MKEDNIFVKIDFDNFMIYISKVMIAIRVGFPVVLNSSAVF